MNQSLLALTLSSFDPSPLCYFSIQELQSFERVVVELRASWCPQAPNLAPHCRANSMFSLQEPIISSAVSTTFFFSLLIYHIYLKILRPILII